MNAASNALARGDHAAAAAEFQKLAERGDKKAQAHLGYMYYVGEGVEQNYAKAVKWYKKAAILGDKDSQYNLAVAFAFGEGVKQSYKEAFHWYRRAAEQNHLVSQYSLGISYAYGEGIPQDLNLAAEWFAKAAEGGYERAQVLLGSLYHTGDGVEKNYQQAAHWYRRAADKGNSAAQYNLGTLYRAGNGVEQDYNQAVRWFRLSADQGYAAAQNELASIERAIAGANRPAPEIEDAPSQVETAPIENVEKSSKTIPTLAKAKPEPEVVEPEVEITKPETAELPDADVSEAVTEVKKEPKRGFFSRLFGKKGKDIDNAKESADTAPEQSGVVYASPEEISAAEVKAYAADSAPARQQLESSSEIKTTVTQVGHAETAAETPLAKPEPEVVEPEVEITKPETAELPDADVSEAVTEVKKEPKRGFFSRLFGKKGKDIDNAKESADTAPEQSGVVYASPEEISAAEVKAYAADSAPARQQLESSSEIKTTVTQVGHAETAAETPLAKPEPEVVEPEVEITKPETAELPDADVSEAVTEVKKEPKRGFFSRLFGKKGKDIDNAKESADTAPEQSGVVYASPEEISAAEVKAYAADSAPARQQLESSSEIKTTVTQVGHAETAAETPLAKPEPEVVEPEVEITKPETAELPDADVSEAVTEVKKEPKRGFFSRLFGKKGKDIDNAKESADTAPEQSGVVYASPEEISAAEVKAYAADSAPARQQLESSSEIKTTVTQVGHAETAAETPLAKPEPEVVEPEVEITKPETAELPDADVSEAVTEVKKEPKRGFFSRLFGKKSKDIDNAKESASGEIDAIETLEEPIVIAKLEEAEEASVENLDVAPDAKNTSGISETQSLAAKGDSNAQFQLGALYYQGKDLKQDYAQAFLWYRRAAQQGNSDAQYNLGNMYLMGEGIKQDDYQARQWYKKAAEQGHESAQHNLASLQRVAMAESEYDSANNNLPEQNNEILKEPEEKRGFFSRLFGKDDIDEEELDETDVAVEETDEFEATIAKTSDDAPEAPDNSPSDIYERGLAFEFGEGVPQNYQTAFEFFKKSAEQNHAPAQYKVGLAYTYGQGTEKDPIVAAEWHRKSASQGYALAQRTLATLYASGEGIEQNKPLALAWYDILADSGNVMDTHRRDALKEKLTPNEIDEANILKQRLSN